MSTDWCRTRSMSMRSTSTRHRPTRRSGPCVPTSSALPRESTWTLPNAPPSSSSTPWGCRRLGVNGRDAARMAKAYAELFAPRPFALTTFANDEDYDELVLARSIPLRSVCEHHLLPFVGVAHVGYLPGERILGLSSSPGWWSFSPAGPGPGTAHHPGRRWLHRPAKPAGRRRRDRGRAHLHDPARGAGRRLAARSPRLCSACSVRPAVPAEFLAPPESCVSPLITTRRSTSSGRSSAMTSAHVS